MSTYQIAVIIGSLRKDSLNRRLANALERLEHPELSFKQLLIGDLPLYNQDDEDNQTESVKRFKQEIISAHGLLFVTPEYNRSIPGVLKNAIDHGSRPRGQNSWEGKPAGVVGVSPGANGTAMAQQHLRNILVCLDVPTLAQPEVFIQLKDGLFDESGNIGINCKPFLQSWMNKYVSWVKKLAV
jgi:chromate reductase